MWLRHFRIPVLPGVRGQICMTCWAGQARQWSYRECEGKSVFVSRWKGYCKEASLRVHGKHACTVCHYLDVIITKQNYRCVKLWWTPLCVCCVLLSSSKRCRPGDNVKAFHSSSYHCDIFMYRTTEKMSSLLMWDHQDVKGVSWCCRSCYHNVWIYWLVMVGGCHVMSGSEHGVC